MYNSALLGKIRRQLMVLPDQRPTTPSCFTTTLIVANIPTLEAPVWAMMRMRSSGASVVLAITPATPPASIRKPYMLAPKLLSLPILRRRTGRSRLDSISTTMPAPPRARSNGPDPSAAPQPSTLTRLRHNLARQAII
eukprot:CAMPEP_0206325936 /NCGR_PEP_ID=MMETSP0106_2-20121207/21341_1 /ASSEMBLY_ACC=CAM_ASM_000206 /TAXON_ID=81532 /ORGANISM="Acanthoeca-like sp., Strain 10tr" /LENGTH=137 /DNA_ID=CAMNT_0053758441 /DNA_START=285 /DNA_END=698 /DNA_ORIENTATION=+